ncbi:hypothetical protein WA1_05165 [Scytonema hofmannii PCC 7110]|uniref:Uncharacterized protein n=1 Tax=Scytonema hofmannii PCC 7110 TaxID=128403 RepID=A0A139WZP8_9CYAN|nr:DUF3598 family protein [Scytonema hofmannii]KYC37890.1 hypothetical protein WA1_05165 [Scytonema hofmannii PCC 7110]
MHSQWAALLKNLGEWQGSFTRLSPLGGILEDTPSVVALEGLDNNQKMRQTIRLGGSEKVLEYSTLARSVLFFDNGAFSQGSIQLAPFSEFGAEFGLIDENQRLRLVQLFDKNLQLDTLTLIREHLAGTQPPQKPPFTVNDLLGEWQGEAVTIYPDWRSPDSSSTKMQLQLDGNGRLVQSLTFGERTISSTATVKNSIIHFDQDPQKQVQVLLLPDGASATSPLKLSLRQPFFLEVGWLIQPGLRQRMIRSYSEKGDWTSLTLVTENKI